MRDKELAKIIISMNKERMNVTVLEHDIYLMKSLDSEKSAQLR